MRRLFALTLVVVLFTLAACGGVPHPQTGVQPNSTSNSLTTDLASAAGSEIGQYSKEFHFDEFWKFFETTEFPLYGPSPYYEDHPEWYFTDYHDLVELYFLSSCMYYYYIQNDIAHEDDSSDTLDIFPSADIEQMNMDIFGDKLSITDEVRASTVVVDRPDEMMINRGSITTDFAIFSIKENSIQISGEVFTFVVEESLHPSMYGMEGNEPIRAYDVRYIFKYMPENKFCPYRLESLEVVWESPETQEAMAPLRNGKPGGDNSTSRSNNQTVSGDISSDILGTWVLDFAAMGITKDIKYSDELYKGVTFLSDGSFTGNFFYTIFEYYKEYEPNDVVTTPRTSQGYRGNYSESRTWNYLVSEGLLKVDRFMDDSLLCSITINGDQMTTELLEDQRIVPDADAGIVYQTYTIIWKRQ